MGICGSVLKSIVVLPLRSGNVLLISPELPNHDVSVRQDGQFSSLVIGQNMISTAVVIMLVHSMASSPDTFSIATVECVLASVVIAGCACLVVIGLISCCGKDAHHRASFLAERHKPHSKKFSLYCFWAFGIASGVLNVFRIAKNIGCMSVPVLGDGFKVGVMFDSLYVLFIFLQMICVTLYISRSVLPSVFVHYCLLFVAMANLSVCIFSIINSAKGAFIESKEYLSICSTNISSVINATDFLSCCYGNTTVASILNDIEPYLYATTIQYALLAGDLVLGMWFFAEHSSLNAGDSAQIDSSLNLENPEHTCMDESIDDESTELLPVSRRHRTYQSVNHQGETTNWKWNAAPGVYIALLISVLIVLSHFGLQGAVHYIKNPSDVLKSTLFWHGFAMKSVMLCVLWQTYYHLHKQSTAVQVHSLEARDYILLFSAMGMMVYQYLYTNATLSSLVPTGNNTSNAQETAKVALGQCILNTVDMYLQTTTILQARRRIKNVHVHTLWPVEFNFLMIAVFNFGLWAIGSMLDIRDINVHYSQLTYYGETVWNVIQHTIYPVGIFYRFHSLLMLYELYNTYRKRKQNSSGEHLFSQ